MDTEEWMKTLDRTRASRGLGAGRALLSWLERHALAAGARRAILETGVRNTAALGLFTSAGYRPVDRYVQGRDPAINRAFARLLTGEG
jgi:ribosomal protein S18 acetylase RimI-like enzyme